MDKKVKRIIDLAEAIADVDKKLDELHEEKVELESQLAEYIGSGPAKKKVKEKPAKKKIKRRATKSKSKKGKKKSKKAKRSELKEGSRPYKVFEFMRKNPGVEYGVPALIRMLGYSEPSEEARTFARNTAHQLVSGGHIERPRRGVYVYVKVGHGGSSEYYDKTILAAVDKSKTGACRDIVDIVHKTMPDKSYSAISAKLWWFARHGQLVQPEKGIYRRKE